MTKKKMKVLRGKAASYLVIAVIFNISSYFIPIEYNIFSIILTTIALVCIWLSAIELCMYRIVTIENTKKKYKAIN